MSIVPKFSSWLAWMVLAVVAVGLSWYFIFQATVQQGGDIAEYYGMTQTVLAEQTLALSPAQKIKLEERLHAAYFDNPHYYVSGRDDKRYPVHFFAYSLLAIPFRLMLELVQLDPLKSLWLVNVWSLMIAIAVIWWRYIKTPWQRMVLLCLAIVSPMMSFFIWPGPDLWYLSMLLVAVFAFLHKEQRLSVFLTVLASWHSQPLIVLAGLLAGYDVLISSDWKLTKKEQKLTLNLQKIWQYALIGLLGLLPYAYNLYAFGNLTPWTMLQDGWTQIRGFGLHNASVRKTFEQLFDLNVGQFWYAPWLYLLGFVTLLTSAWKKKWDLAWLTLFIFITAIFYQTNPGWHYGTSGYGPGRHSLLYLPLAITATFQLLKKKTFLTVGLFLLATMSHLTILSFNSFLEPNLAKTLHHSVFAEYVLENHPQWYTPTPEIFVDRTNHDDQTLPTTAIYKNKDGKCVKAWVLLTDTEQLEKECGTLTLEQKLQLDDRFLKISNQPRQVITTEATFWPYSDACADWFYKTPEKPYECMQSLDEVIRLTGVTDAERITPVPEFPYPGIWKVTAGEPIMITVPPGYIINHQSLEGVYVDFD